MIPVYLSPQATRIALVGRSERAISRLAWLRAAGAAPDVWSDTPTAALKQAAAAHLREGLPGYEDLAGYHVVWIADLPQDTAAKLAQSARSLHRLVNVEDIRALCDFHTPALVRRGDLTLAAGTGGASPAVARAARERLEATFPDDWGDALENIAHARRALRELGASSVALADDARSRLTALGLI